MLLLVVLLLVLLLLLHYGGYFLSYHAHAHWVRSFRSLSVHFLIAFLRRVPLMGPGLATLPHWHSFFFVSLLSSPSLLVRDCGRVFQWVSLL